MAGTLRSVAIVGAGPAGLYFAILMKKAAPFVDITVYERNRIGDTFGFGVVFSDATLDIFERYDAESYRAITENFAYWDDIEIRFKDTVHRIGGNGFCGCSRQTLLILLHKGRGGGLSDMFGGGSASSIGSSGVAERNLNRFTIVVGLTWTVVIVLLGVMERFAQ